MRFRTDAEEKKHIFKKIPKLLAKVALQSFEGSKIVGVKIRISTSRMVKLGCYQSRLLSPRGFFFWFEISFFVTLLKTGHEVSFGGMFHRELMGFVPGRIVVHCIWACFCMFIAYCVNLDKA